MRFFYNVFSLKLNSLMTKHYVKNERPLIQLSNLIYLNVIYHIYLVIKAGLNVCMTNSLITEMKKTGHIYFMHIAHFMHI